MFQKEPDYSGLRQLKVNNNSIMQYKMTLLKNSGEKIMNLGNSKIGSISVQNGQAYQLTFTVPRYFTDDITLEVIKNDEYDYVVNKQIVQINDRDKFIIEDVVENDGTGSAQGDTFTTKSVTAYSLDFQLTTRMINLPQMERELYSDKPDISKGYLNLVDEASSWTLNYLDPNAIVEHWNGGTSTKYRLIGDTNSYVYPFMTNTLSSLFNIITFFNSYNKTYDVFDLDTYGTKRPFILSLENIITDFQRETNVQNIVTRLHCTGQNNLVFTNINPLGTDYLEDITAFRNSKYMSLPLLKALDRYDNLTTNLHKQFLSLRGQLTNLQTTLDSINENVDTLKSNQVIYGQEQSALLKALSNYPKGNITISGNLKDLQNKIKSNNDSLNSALKKQQTTQDSINSIMNQLQEIGNQYDKHTAKDSQGLIFTKELIDEYDNFIIDGTYSNTSCTTPEELMKEGTKYLKQQVEPVYTFTLGVNDFLQGLPFNEEEKMNITLNLGDKVRIVNKTMGIDTYVRFIGYEITPLSDELTMTFSTLSIQQNSISTLSDTLSNLNKTAQEVNINKYFWNMSKGTADWVENFRTSSLDLVSKEIKSKTSQNEIDINENGIYLIDSNNTKDQLAMTNNIIAMTTDGWETASVAITPYWINGNLICANSIATESLSLSTQTAINSGKEALEGLGTLTQEFTVAKGELESEINKKIGEDQMWSILKQSPEEFSSLVGETTAIKDVYTQIKQTANSIKASVEDVKDNLQSSIEENANEITSKVSVEDLGTEIEQNAKSVQIAWNKNSESITFTDGEIVCKGNRGTVKISGDGGITYSRNGQSSGFSNSSFMAEVQIQNGMCQNIQLPAIFQGLTMGVDYQVMAWAGEINSNYGEVYDKDAIRNIFVRIVSSDAQNGTVTVMPCLQKIGLETHLMWGWDSQSTTGKAIPNQGMINVIIYAVMLTSPIVK